MSLRAKYIFLKSFLIVRVSGKKDEIVSSFYDIFRQILSFKSTYVIFVEAENLQHFVLLVGRLF